MPTFLCVKRKVCLSTHYSSHHLAMRTQREQFLVKEDEQSRGKHFKQINCLINNMLKLSLELLVGNPINCILI